MRYLKRSLILVFILLIISIGSVSANDENILSDSSNISDCGSMEVDNSDSTYSKISGSNSLADLSSSAVSNGASSVSNDSAYYKSNDGSISVSDMVSDVSSNSIENSNSDKTDSLKNIYSSGKVISITPDNYKEYFSEEGYVNTSKVSPYDTLDFSGRFNFPNGVNDDLLDISFIFTIPVIVTSINHDAYFKDSTIQFDHVNASLNAPSVVSNLNINNTLCSGLNGVLCTFSQHVLIMNNTIFTESSSGNPVRLGFSNYINVTNNALKTYYVSTGTSFNQSWTHSCILLAESHHNYIGSNVVEVKESNPIYLSAYGVGPSNYNIIFNNTISSYSVSNVTGLSNPSSWTYGIQMMGNHNQAINNTIHNVFRGISCGDDAVNNTIVGNIIFNITGGYYEGNDGTEGGEYGILGVPNSLIANNTIYGSSLTGGAIAVSSGSTVYGNIISVGRSDKGIVMSQVSNNTNIYENIINTNSGTGLYALTYMSNVTINNNVINSNNGTGIHIKRASKDKLPSNILISNNYIQTGGTFINLTDAGSNNISCINNTLQKVIFIDKNNFFNYFDNNATLINRSELSGAYIIFEGEFDDLGISQITINQAVKIFGNNSIMRNIQLNIVSDDVTIENVHMVMEKNKPAIYLNNVNNFKIINSNLIGLNNLADLNNSINLDDEYVEDYVKNVNSMIFVDKSIAYIYSNNISTNGSLAIYVNSGSNVIVSNNIINTSNFNYTIDLTDSGSETLKNNVSNNLLISENSLGTSTVLFNGSADNNILLDNDCISTNLVMLNSSVFVNTNPIVKIKIVDLQNNPLSNLIIKIIVKESDGNLLNYSVMSDSKGIASLDLDLTVGNYSIYALFEGNSIYNSSDLSSNLEVRYMDTSINMSAPNYYYSENVIVTVYLKGDNGAVDLNDKSIILDVNGRKYYSKTVNGVAKFELGSLPIGNYIVKATFEADENCTGAELSSSFKVNIMPTSLDANNVTVMYNNGSNLIIYLKDINGKAIASKSVSITINGKTYTKMTNGDGKVSISLNTLVPKTYTTNISFSGDSYYSSVKKTVYVKVKTRSTKIVASNLVKYYGDSKNIVVYLKDSNNVAISSKTVSIKINGKTYKKTTDKNGKVSLSISSLPKKSYKTVIKFSATYYGSSSKTITVNVVKPKIKAVSTSIKKGKQLSVVFKDYKGKILTYKKVYFKFKGKTYTLTTNGKGISTLTCNIKKGLYSIVAGFKSTASYGKTTATIKFKVY
ncbi:MAG: Ig-like domain-containing protein [archaeon]|nr:Ig-like domain-containing protein [archaeon]